MKYLIPIALSFIISFSAQGQCVNTFPYHEDFEASAGNWFSGGNNNDWAWGSPSKPTITGAGSGAKCWIVGGLNGTSYADGELSWVQSPCFDFTNLQHPYIHFKYFWESEHQYDGGNLQYSINGGTKWTNVGSIFDPVDCLDSNWYDYNPIKFLNGLAVPQAGWSGNIQNSSGGCAGGSGSGGWVVCRHCMSYLAGESNVIFRFTFGAGTTCNNFDGNAFDDIYIENAPSIVPDFSFSCLGGRKVSFQDLSTLCPASWKWDFDDAGSGTADTSSQQNPQHHFSAPGTYTVSLTSGSDCSGSYTVTHTVVITGVKADSVAESCYGFNDGKAIASAGPATATYQYLWNTQPAQTTDTIKNLVPGTYTVTVTTANGCSSVDSTTVTAATQLLVTSQVVQPLCNGKTGDITLTTKGGNAPYMYSWLPNVSAGASAKNIVGGDYNVTVSDKNNCAFTDSFNIATPPAITLRSKTTPDTCDKGLGSAVILANGGIPPYQYLWLPGSLTSDSIHNFPGIYVFNVTVNDKNNCTDTITVTIPSIGNIQVNLGNDTTICPGQVISLSPGAGFLTYHWQDSSTNSNFDALQPGRYWVRVINGGCIASDTIVLKLCPVGLLMPNAFSPNGDGINETLKVILLENITTYLMRIYDRWGELVFETTTPDGGWDGTFRGRKSDTGVYVYYVEYTAAGIKNILKGNVVLLR